ncbi:hypothetical protein [Kitasatospora sp. NPDC090091]
MLRCAVLRRTVLRCAV